MRNASKLPFLHILLLFITLSISNQTFSSSHRHRHDHSSFRFSTFQSSDHSHSDQENYEETSIFKYPRVGDLEALLKDKFFFGDWSEESESDCFHFDNERGFSTLVCQAGSSCVPNLHIFDGPYKTRESLLFLYSADIVRRQMESYNKTNASLTYVDINVNMLRHSALHAVPTTCNTITSVYFINTSSHGPFLSEDPQKDQEFFGVQFEVESPECEFHILTSIMVPSDSVFDSQILDYILLMTAFAVIEGGACIRLYKIYKRQESQAKKVSKGTLALMNAFSFYLAFFTAFQFLNPVSYYAFVSLIYAVLAFALWPRLIWKVTIVHIRRIDPRRKAKAVVQAYFWMLAIVVVPLLSISVNDYILYYIEALALVPQIIHNYQHSRKYQWNFELVTCIVIPKVLFVSYIQADPQNLFRSEPNFIIAAVYLGLLSGQCLTLLIQTRWPRFGNEVKLPYDFLLSKEVNPKEDVCSVCLENLKKSDAIRKSLLEGSKSRKMIITPCKHKFHEPCLKTWLKTKSECPNCRKQLPILDDDDDDEIIN